MNEHHKYLVEVVPQLLSQLDSDAIPAFGIMSAQHMVEHLIWVTKSTAKDYGPAPEVLGDKQMGFMRFIEKGAHFEHRPSDKKKEDLDAPRMKSLQNSIDTVPEALERLYSFPRDHIFYNPMMGRLSFAQLELFHAKHFEYHLEKQFGLSIHPATA